MIGIPHVRGMDFAQVTHEAFLRHDDIADAIWSLAQQSKSAWTFELDVRP